MLGQIFTTKYNFVFNTNEKQIGFYQKINKDTNKDIINNNYNNKNNNKIIITIVIIVAIIFTCVGLLLGRKIFGWRHKI